MIIDDVTIMDTMEMVEEFERDFGYRLAQEDRLEIFRQLFEILDKHTPLDLTDRNILMYEQLIFANHLSVDRAAVDRLAYRLMVRVWDDIRQRGYYVGGELMYFPYSMLGWDLTVRRYKN